MGEKKNLTKGFVKFRYILTQQSLTKKMRFYNKGCVVNYCSNFMFHGGDGGIII